MVQTDLTPQEINIQEIDAQEVQKVNSIVADTEAYKERLKQLPEVQALTNEISVQDVNTIVNFGQKSAEEITKISDKILSIAKVPNTRRKSLLFDTLQV